MKKLIVLALLIALCAGIAFADGVAIGAWGRGIWAPLLATYGNGTAQVTGSTGISWGGNAARVGFQINGTSEFAGFHATLDVDNNSLGVSDDQYLWVKPVPGLMLQIGRVYNDTLRGSAGFGSWDWIRGPGSTSWGDDYVFTRIGGNGAPPNNAVLSFTMGGLFIFVEQAFQSTTSYYGDSTNKNQDPINKTSVGAGYTIEGIGKIRVQRVGLDDVISTTQTQIQAAFNLTAVPNLNVDLGVKVPLNIDGSTPTVTAWIPLYASYKVAGATILLSGMVQLNNGGTNGTNLGYQAAVGANYDLGMMGLGLTADVRYSNQYINGFSGGTNSSVISFLAGLTKGFSNGMIGIGVQVISGANLGWNNVANPAANPMQWAVPIKMEYWF